MLEEDIFLTPSDHQKDEDVRGEDGKKTVTVSDSLGGNVINCKWTGAWYFKMQPKQRFENSHFVIRSFKNKIAIFFCWLSI